MCRSRLYISLRQPRTKEPTIFLNGGVRSQETIDNNNNNMPCAKTRLATRESIMGKSNGKADPMGSAPEVHVKPREYQPNKADLEEDFTIRRADGSIPTPAEVAATALQPMRIVEGLDA